MSNLELVDNYFDQGIENLSKFVEIPNLSPGFDKEFFSNGLNQKAMQHVIDQAYSLNISGLKHEIFAEEKRSPILQFEVDSHPSKSDSSTIMLQGHIDKQPHMSGWHDFTGPCTPVVREGQLQGRGSADDGYSQVAVLVAIKANQQAGQPLPRVLFMMETEEESGSPNLGQWLNKLKSKIGNISLMFCLDSMAADQQRMWVTKGLKGVAMLTVKVQTHEFGVHSGNQSGRIPDPTFVHRYFMDQLCDVYGNWKQEKIDESISESDLAKIDAMRHITQNNHMDMCLLDGVKPVGDDALDSLVRNVWKPTLTCIGTDGLGDLSSGNVVQPSLTMKYSVRLPPKCDAQVAMQSLKELFLKKNQFNAKVEILNEVAGNGFYMSDFTPQLEEHFNAVSNEIQGNDVAYCFCGGSIPFLNTIQKSFDGVTVVATGVIGPGTNEHASNERLDIEYCRKITKCITKLIAK